ncbi:MAG: hypothetical protein L0G23_05510 [Ruaniaceae bacterium]|nr:hypothetical protein [Ruaniaceae bacterium]
MSTLTFLGASGGSGTTTLAAISAHMLAENGMRLPALIAEDFEAFSARLGTPPRGVQRSGDELVDGGRYATRKAAAALAQGTLVLVSALAPRGVAALDEALAAVGAEFGGAARERTVLVQCESFGPPVGSPHPDAVRVPFDRALAPGGPISLALGKVRTQNREHLWQHWLPILREAYSVR